MGASARRVITAILVAIMLTGFGYFGWHAGIYPGNAYAAGIGTMVFLILLLIAYEFP